MSGELDHLVYATPDAAQETDRIAEALGVAPVAGGRHPGFGTRNFLLGLGGRRYLEIIGPDPEAAPPSGPRPFGIDQLRAGRLVTWAIRVDDLDEAVRRAGGVGAELGPPVAMSRATPDGGELSWRLVKREPQPFHGVVPFLIDWGVSTHPTAGELPGAELIDFRARYHDPAVIRPVLAALGVDLEVAAGDPGLAAVVRGPAGELALG